MFISFLPKGTFLLSKEAKEGRREGGITYLIRGILGVDGHLEHLLEGGHHGVLEHAGLVGGVVQVLVHGVGGLLGRLHLFLGVCMVGRT